MKNKSSRTRNKKDDKNYMPIITKYAISFFVFSLVSSVLLLLFSKTLTIQNVPHKLFVYLSIFAVSVGSFSGAFVLSKQIKENGMRNGLIFGSIIAVTVYIISIYFSGIEFGLPLYVRTFSILILSTIGGILGVNLKRKIKY